MHHIYPPAILGHDEQELLKNSGLPAAAWVHDLRVVPMPTKDDPGGAKLQAKMGDAPGSVCKLINRRAYRKTSAEVYDDPPDGCGKVNGVKGKVLRAVAFLGRDIPRVKTLDDIPQFNESTGQSTDWVDIFATGTHDGQKYVKADLDDMSRNYRLLSKAGISPAQFSEKQGGKAGVQCRRLFWDTPQEGRPMDELRKKLIAAGMPEATVNAMDDTALQQFAQACAGFAGAAAGTPAPAAGAGVAANGDMPGSNEPGSNPAVQTNEGTKTADPATLTKLSDSITKRVLESLKLSGSEGEQATARIKEIEQNTTLRLFGDKVRGLINAGIIAPSVNEGDLIEGIAQDIVGGKNLRKFGDKEVSLESRFGLLLDRLAQQKLPRLGEKAASGDPRKFSDAEKSAEIEKVKAHYRKYSDRFASCGTTEEAHVKAFEYMQKNNGITAEDFTGERD